MTVPMDTLVNSARVTNIESNKSNAILNLLQVKYPTVHVVMNASFSGTTASII